MVSAIQITVLLQAVLYIVQGLNDFNQEQHQEFSLDQSYSENHWRQSRLLTSGCMDGCLECTQSALTCDVCEIYNTNRGDSCLCEWSQNLAWTQTGSEYTMTFTFYGLQMALVPGWVKGDSSDLTCFDLTMLDGTDDPFLALDYVNKMCEAKYVDDLSFKYYNTVTKQCGLSSVNVGQLIIKEISEDGYQQFITNQFQLLLNLDASGWIKPCRANTLKTQIYPLDPSLTLEGCSALATSTTCLTCKPFTRQYILYQLQVDYRQYSTCEAQFRYKADFTVSSTVDSNTLTFEIYGVTVITQYLSALSVNSCWDILRLNNFHSDINIKQFKVFAKCTGTISTVTFQGISDTFSVPKLKIEITKVQDTVLLGYLTRAATMELISGTVSLYGINSASKSLVMTSNVKGYNQNCVSYKTERPLECLLCSPYATSSGLVCINSPVASHAIGEIPSTISDFVSMDITLKNVIYKDELIEYFQYTCERYFSISAIQGIDWDTYATDNGYTKAQYETDLTKMVCELSIVENIQELQILSEFFTRQFSYSATLVKMTNVPKLLYLAYSEGKVNFNFVLKSNDYELTDPYIGSSSQLQVNYPPTCVQGCAVCIVGSICSACSHFTKLSGSNCNCNADYFYKVSSIKDDPDCEDNGNQCLRLTVYNTKLNVEDDIQYTDCSYFLEVAAIITPDEVDQFMFEQAVAIMTCRVTQSRYQVYGVNNNTMAAGWAETDVLTIDMFNVQDSLIYGYMEGLFTVSLHSSIYYRDCTLPTYQIKKENADLLYLYLPPGCITILSGRQCKTCNPYTILDAGACKCTFHHEVRTFGVSEGLIVMHNVQLKSGLTYPFYTPIACTDLFTYDISATGDAAQLGIDLAAMACSIITSTQTDTTLLYNYDTTVISLKITSMSQLIVDLFGSGGLKFTLNMDKFIQECAGAADYTIYPRTCMLGCDSCLNQNLCQVCSPFTKQGVDQVLPTFQETSCDCQLEYNTLITQGSAVSTNQIQVNTVAKIILVDTSYECSELFTFSTTDTVAQQYLSAITCSLTLSKLTPVNYVTEYDNIQATLLNVHDSIVLAFQKKLFTISLLTSNVYLDCAGDNQITYKTGSFDSTNCILTSPDRAAFCTFCNPYSQYSNGLCSCKWDYTLAVADSTTTDIAELMTVTLTIKNFKLKDQLILILQEHCSNYIEYTKYDTTWDDVSYQNSFLTDAYTQIKFQEDDKKRSCVITTGTETGQILNFQTQIMLGYTYPFTQIQIKNVPKIRAEAIKLNKQGIQLKIQDYYLTYTDHGCAFPDMKTVSGVSYLNLAYDKATCMVGCDYCSSPTQCAQCNGVSTLTSNQCICDQLYQQASDCSNSNNPQNCVQFKVVGVYLNDGIDMTDQDCTKILEGKVKTTMSTTIESFFPAYIKEMKCVLTQSTSFVQVGTPGTANAKNIYTNVITLKAKFINIALWNALYYDFAQFALKSTAFTQKCTTPIWKLDNYIVDSTPNRCLSYTDANNYICDSCISGYILYPYSNVQTICVKEESGNLIGALNPNDPCLLYTDTTRKYCATCKQGYKLLLFNSQRTICGKKDPEEKICTIDATYYTDIAILKYPYITTNYDFVQDDSGQYCFNCLAYYVISTSASYKYTCWDCQIPPQIDLLTKAIYAKSIGCTFCDPDYKDLSLVANTATTKMVRECGAKQVNAPSCTLNEYLVNGVCVKCSTLFPGCASCTPATCLFCPFGSYQQKVYDYNTGEKKDLCLFGACEPGYGVDQELQQCVECQVENCFQCNDGDPKMTCQKCNKGYYVTLYNGFVPASCSPMAESASLTLFVKSGAPYTNTTVGFSASNYISASRDGSTPAKAYYFLKQAISKINQLSHVTKQVDAIIYIGKGEHFFYHCDQIVDLQNKIPSIDAEQIWFNCVDMFSFDLNTIFHLYQGTDHINYQFKALQCSMGPDLGLDTDTDFLDQCVDLKTVSRPKIFINQNTAYFNITATATFENLIFSGINSLAEANRIAYNFQSSLPTKLCQLTAEITGSDGILPSAVIEYPELINQGYSCRDLNYSGSSYPVEGSTTQCELTQDQQFYSQRESTLVCSGEPGHSTYFSKNSKGTYYLRRRTLFNLYAYSDYESYYQKTPSLKIVNCDFEHFLREYESLVNVEHNNLQKSKFAVSTIELPYYTSTGGQRGAQISISNSNFRDSRFCKGLIVHRRQNYIKEFLSYSNYTHFYMESPLINDADSYIFISSSTFKNLNVYTNVKALALNDATVTLKEDNQQQAIQYKAFKHKGIVLNIADFNGPVEIINCDFQRNMHFLPDILITERSTTDLTSFEQYQDTSSTKELKLVICNQKQVDEYFFQTGFQTDIDANFDAFERLGLFLITRNKQKMIFAGNTFNNIIGTFGGSITIDSPDWRNGNSPYILIVNNTFTNNMAYFSGNAIYIRNTKRTLEMEQICAGVHLESNIFRNNSGLKVHNGGAVAIYCQHLLLLSHKDYDATSSYTGNALALERIMSEGVLTKVTSLVNGKTYSIYQFKVGIINCEFRENYSGRKGTAVYVRQINGLIIKQCTFQQNGPLYSAVEKRISPYYKYLQQRSLSYNNTICKDEYTYLQTCSSIGKYIDWPQIYGTVYVEHCQTIECLDANYFQNALILHSQFVNNSAQPIMDKRFSNTQAQEIFILGGFNNQINNVTFHQVKTRYDYQIPTLAPTIIGYLPDSFYSYSQSTLIYVSVSSDMPLTVTEFVTQIINCKFSSHKHIQIVGLTSSQKYSGSLFRYNSNYGSTNYLIVPQVKFINSTFTDNYFIGSDTSLLQINNGLLDMSGCTFQNNGYLSQRSKSNVKTYFNKFSQYYDFESYSMNYYQQYGLIDIRITYALPTGKYHQIRNNIFVFSFASTGSVISLFVDNQYVLLQNNKYNQNFAFSGSAIYAQPSTYRSTVKIMQDQLINQFNLDSGAIFVNGKVKDVMNLWVVSSYFSNSYAIKGGALNVYQGGKIFVDSSTFTNDRSLKSSSYIQGLFQKQSAALSDFIDLQLLNQLVDKTSLDQSVIYLDATSNSQSFLFAGELIQPIQDKYLQYSEFRDCSYFGISSNKSSVFTIQESKCAIYNLNSNNKMERNTQVANGVIQVRSGELICDKLIIQNNRASQSISALYATNSKVSCSNMKFLNNYAEGQATLFVEMASTFICSNCIFTGNYASDTSILFGSNIDSQQITFLNSVFTNNTSQRYLIQLLTAGARIESSQFIDNFSQEINHGITLISSSLVASNILVNYTDLTRLRNNIVDSGFFILNYQSNMTLINNSVINNCMGTVASVVSVSGNSGFTSEGNVLISNCYSQTGSAFRFTSASKVVIRKTKFINNTDNDVYLQLTSATIEASEFQYTKSSSVKAIQASIDMTNSTFSQGSNQDVQGKGVYCECISFTVNNCIFRNLTALQGGALYLSAVTSGSKFTFTNSTFELNKAQYGGALQINDASTMVFKGNKFIGNQANLLSPQTLSSSKLIPKGMGGAMYIACSSDLFQQAGVCKASFSGRNIFKNNSAQHDGGAVIWVDLEIQEDGSSVYDNNIAPYGQNIGSSPKDLKFEFISNNDYGNPINYNRRRLTDQSFPMLNSGTAFVFNIYILDPDGNVYSTDNSSIASLKPRQPAGISIANNEIPAVNGIFRFTDVTIDMLPGSTSDFILEIKMPYSIGSSITFLDQIPTFDIQVRKCIAGESYTSSLRCEKCPAGTYLLEAPESETNCKSCMENTICYGGNKIVPMNGYWRSNDTSDNIIKCPNAQSCQQNEGNYTCSTGYKGILCAQCELGYYQSDDFKCKRCPSRQGNLAQLIIMVFAYLLNLSYLVKSTLGISKKQQHTIYVKILTTHFQIMSLIMSISITYPKEIENMLTSNSQPNKITAQMFSLQCFLLDQTSDNTEKALYSYIIIFTLMPIMMTVAATVFWGIYSQWKRSKEYIRNHLVRTIVIMLFLVYPDLTKKIFSFLNCYEVEGVYRLKINLGTVCYKDTHLVMMLTLLLPALVLWVLGIPLLALFILWRNRAKLLSKPTPVQEEVEVHEEQTVDIRERFGFLIYGYELNLCFWEIVKMLRGAIMAMLTVFLSVISASVQMLVCLIIVVICIYCQLRFNPYFNPLLNQMELYSLITVAITLYACFFYVAGETSTYMNAEGMKWFILILMVIPNVMYLLFWAFHMRLQVLKIIWSVKNKTLFKIACFGQYDYGKFGDQYMTEFLKVQYKGNLSLSGETRKALYLQTSPLQTSTNKAKKDIVDHNDIKLHESQSFGTQDQLNFSTKARRHMRYLQQNQRPREEERQQSLEEENKSQDFDNIGDESFEVNKTTRVKKKEDAATDFSRILTTLVKDKNSRIERYNQK